MAGGEVSLLSCWVSCSGVPLCFHYLPHPNEALRSLGGHPKAQPGLAQLLGQGTCAGPGRLQRRIPAGAQSPSRKVVFEFWGVSLLWETAALAKEHDFSAECAALEGF